MHLTTLSGAIVALALAGQGSGFGDTFLLFGIAVLPVVLFVGVGTFVRLGSANYVDAQCVIGMNRIRAGYLEMAPDLERFFVSGVHDDRPGVARTMGIDPAGSPLVHLMAATPTIVSVVNSAVTAGILGFVLLLVRAHIALVMPVAVVVFIAAFAGHGICGRSRVARMQASTRPMFPGPDQG